MNTAVNDVNSVIGDLKRYIEDFKKTASTRAGHGVLPVIVTQAVQEFHDEVALIEVLSPPSSHRQNLRWGLGRKRKAKEATEKLEKRKTTLPLALQVFGR